MTEYREALNRERLRFSIDQIGRVLSLIEPRGVCIIPEQSSLTSPDPTDTKFIASAPAKSADYLVTGNRRHFPEPRYGSTEIVNAAELLARLKQQT